MKQYFLKNNVVERVIRNMMNSQILLEDKLQDLQNEYQGEYDEDIEYIYHQDPTKSKKYFKWIFETWLKNRGRNIDYEDLISMVIYFDKNPNKFEKKDLYQYTYDEFLKSYNEAILKMSKREIVSSGVEKLYEDDKYVLLRPKTAQASCKYGANTKWCIASRTNNYFESYNEDNLFFFIIDKLQEPIPGRKKSPNYFKVAIQYEPYTEWDFEPEDLSQEYKNKYLKQSQRGTFTFWNSIDESVTKNTVKKYIPEQIFNKFLELIKNYTYQLYNAYYEKQLKEFQQFDFKKYEETESQIQKLRSLIREEERKYISNDHVNFVDTIEDTFYTFQYTLSKWNLPQKSLDEFLEFKGIKEKFYKDLEIRKNLKNKIESLEEILFNKTTEFQRMSEIYNLIYNSISFRKT